MFLKNWYWKLHLRWRMSETGHIAMKLCLLTRGMIKHFGKIIKLPFFELIINLVQVLCFLNYTCISATWFFIHNNMKFHFLIILFILDFFFVGNDNNKVWIWILMQTNQILRFYAYVIGFILESLDFWCHDINFCFLICSPSIL